MGFIHLFDFFSTVQGPLGLDGKPVSIPECVCVCVCVWKTDSGFSHYWTFIYLICLSKVVCKFLSGILLSNGLSFWTNLLTEAASKLMLLSFDDISLLLLIFIAHKH